MKISEKIKELCFRSNISIAELARRLNASPQSLHGKMRRESFTVAELEKIADAVDCKFEYGFQFYNGIKI